MACAVVETSERFNLVLVDSLYACNGLCSVFFCQLGDMYYNLQGYFYFYTSGPVAVKFQQGGSQVFFLASGGSSAAQRATSYI